MSDPLYIYDIASLGPVNVSFYDGGHTEEDQYRAFTRFDRILTDPFLAIVDDGNWERVRAGTRRTFAELHDEALAMWNLDSPGNGSRDGWWNGLFLAVVSRTKRS